MGEQIVGAVGKGAAEEVAEEVEEEAEAEVAELEKGDAKPMKIHIKFNDPGHVVEQVEAAMKGMGKVSVKKAHKMAEKAGVDEKLIKQGEAFAKANGITEIDGKVAEKYAEQVVGAVGKGKAEEVAEEVEEEVEEGKLGELEKEAEEEISRRLSPPTAYPSISWCTS